MSFNLYMEKVSEWVKETGLHIVESVSETLKVSPGYGHINRNDNIDPKRDHEESTSLLYAGNDDDGHDLMALPVQLLKHKYASIARKKDL
mmetsp:Transcript_17747/g.21862  ORF Transcript_17747/g.21862 Transcript_17747/m.21862 type:complete len:90 (-) Transcript_17747:737-1006(-)|eukprot:CAMPEP_0204859184 /NCGR_PEP_ID=MMETSP1347-20130617/23536_1 /ASSEMBLY_ACC=CAM_ASM_000690 /TAXON_ID=215587 /ORGANISM="Aplanochytrium stocchinoi, Strain GSBS06" /LENGTH=89 /DNA_ID=CAMNT_0052007587 /DNA_START=187 /DNA_END=456 /DNA_ORIENTATION=+